MQKFIMGVRTMTLILILGLTGSFAAPAMAVQCWLNGSLNMDFGLGGGSAPTATWGSMTMACYGPWSASGETYHVRTCHFIGADPATGAVDPRYLTRWDGTRMQYDLYADPNFTQLLGPPGNSNQMSSASVDVPNNATQTWNLMVYGRIPARIPGLSAGIYQSHFGGGLVKWRWSKASAPTPTAAECLAGTGGEGGGEVSYYLNVVASAEDTCMIRSVTDIDFGTHEHDITAPLDQRSSLTLQCPVGTTWQLALNEGLYSAGGERRMSNGQGDFAQYQIYRDAARTQTWGNKNNVNTLSGVGAGISNPIMISLYGRVLPQNGLAQGHYQDTVIVTLTY